MVLNENLKFTLLDILKHQGTRHVTQKDSENSDSSVVQMSV